MAITYHMLTSTPETSEGENLRETWEYVFKGSADRKAIRDEALAQTPYSRTATDGYHTLIRKGIHLSAKYVDENDPDRSYWGVEIEYGPWPQGQSDETGKTEYSFDTTGETFRATQSRKTVAAYSATSNGPPNFGGALNVTRNSDGTNDVEGVEIYVPSFSWSVRKYVDDDAITGDYKRTLASLTGTVNSAPYAGLDTGEVLFMGARGSQRSQDDWEIDYEFSTSPNRRDFYVGNINVPFKYGWDYMWVRYAADENGGELVEVPRHVYIERLYPFRDLDRLGVEA
jgi:hypothetical protein